MTDYGRNKITEAKQNGQWDKEATLVIGDEQIAQLSSISLDCGSIT